MVEKEERGGAEAGREEKPESERGKGKEEGLNEDSERGTPYQPILHAELTLYHCDLITGHHTHVLGY